MLAFQLNVIGLVAQKDTIYLDNNGKITIKGFDTFYRVCDYYSTTKFPEKDFVDYYANSNRIYVTGFQLFSNYQLDVNSYPRKRGIYLYTKNALII